MRRNIYLALGDSVSAGYSASHPSFSFVERVNDFLRQEAWVDEAIVVARNGWTTKNIWQAAMRIHPDIWDRTHVLTLMTGGNDLRNLLRRTYFPFGGQQITPELVEQKLAEFSRHLNQLCHLIAQHQVPHVVFANVYNPVPNFPLGVHALKGLNHVTRQVVGQYNFDIVDVHERFKSKEKYYIEGYRSGRFEDLLTAVRRPIHPNNAGHKEIAELIITSLKNQSETGRNRHMPKSKSSRVHFSTS